MATKYQNLSDYDPNTLPSKDLVSNQKYAIVQAEWNREITDALAQGAYDTLVKNGVKENNIEIVRVPGTFELTYATAKMQKSGKFNSIIAIGCVIQGDTPHFDYVCGGVTEGITHLNTLTEGCPVIFGVLTTNTLQQSKDRAGGILGNKGDESAITAIKMSNIIW